MMRMRIRGGQEVESRSACAEETLVTAEHRAKGELGVTSDGDGERGIVWFRGGVSRKRA